MAHRGERISRSKNSANLKQNPKNVVNDTGAQMGLTDEKKNKDGKSHTRAPLRSGAQSYYDMVSAERMKSPVMVSSL